jgi:hypothetical protein
MWAAQAQSGIVLCGRQFMNSLGDPRNAAVGAVF